MAPPVSARVSGEWPQAESETAADPSARLSTTARNDKNRTETSQRLRMTWEAMLCAPRISQ
jgi:hypothetical protein